ncbi:Mg(2+) transport ATPase protein C [Filimonas lacunae]|nr:Mg(2+) transport ATPase protein C [Filimonas lacunae]
MIVWTEVALRLGLAAMLGGAIGLERERKDWAAGLRTHMMVCVGASLTMIVSAYGFADILGTPHVELDPSRIAAQVISGIGFIGAGTILFLKQGIIRGLTTASGLWTVAAIGLATGGGMYFAALLTTVLALIILWVLQPFEKRISARFIQKGINIVAAKQEYAAAIVKEIMQRKDVDIANCTITNTEEGHLVSFKFKHISKEELSTLISEFQSAEGVKEINWNN